MTAQYSNESINSIMISCFQSEKNADISKKPLLSDIFFTKDQKRIKLKLYPTCMTLTQQNRTKPTDQVKVFIFTNRSSFSLVESLTDKDRKYTGIIIFDNWKQARKDVFYNSNQQICQTWNDTLQNFINQRGFRQQYDLLDFIGKGHSSKVYKARNRKSSEIVAVKMFQKSSDSKLQQAFLNEIKILRTINHSNVLKLYGSFYQDGFVCAITEYCSGGTLYNQITTKPSYNKEQQIKMILDLTNAVEHLRTHNIVHRDIKLQNIFIREESGQQTYVLGDFGLAAYSNEKAPVFETCGTVGYVAPQILRNSGNKPMGVSHKLDIFSLGAICHIILLRRTVFAYTQGNVSQLMDLNKKCFINWNSNFYKTIPKQELELLQCTLTENPQNRFTTKQLLSLPFFKKHQQKIPKTNQSTESKSFKSSSTRPNSNYSTSNPNFPMLQQFIFLDTFSPKEKKQNIPKTQAIRKWSFFSWLKNQQKQNHCQEIQNSFDLEEGFIQERIPKQRFDKVFD